MEGASVQQAKAALLLALDDLKSGDKFNVIDFDSAARPLFGDSKFADAQSIASAKSFVEKITADGGTEMLSALQLAMPDNPRTPSGTVRAVIFMTDGQVSNEQELFTFIHTRLGESRLFTVGIGAAPNSHFMRNAARFGRGTFTYIGDVQQVQERMSELFAKLDAPVMTSISIHSSDAMAESWPERVPDLYRGEPLVVAMRVHDASAKITLHGSIGNETRSEELTHPQAGAAPRRKRPRSRRRRHAATNRDAGGAAADDRWIAHWRRLSNDESDEVRESGVGGRVSKKTSCRGFRFSLAPTPDTRHPT